MDHFVARVLFLCAVTASSPLFAGEAKRLFDGKTLTGWEGDTKYTWRVEKGAIVGGSLKRSYLATSFSAQLGTTVTSS